MNAAVRALSSVGGVSLAQRQPISTLSVFRLFIVLIPILLSILGIIYLKDMNRRLTAEYYSLQQEKQQALMQFEQLLSDYSRWSTQPFLEQAGEVAFHMHIPTHQEVVLLQVRVPDDAP